MNHVLLRRGLMLRVPGCIAVPARKNGFGVVRFRDFSLRSRRAEDFSGAFRVAGIIIYHCLHLELSFCIRNYDSDCDSHALNTR